MKKLLVAIAIVSLLVILMVPTVFAYSNVTGCVVDANEDPWTHGGTATYVDNGGGGTHSADLDANGCFNIEVGFTIQGGVVTIVFNDGGAGTPADQTCDVPEGDFGGDTYECENISTNTGPNAVTWTAVNADAPTGVPLEAAAFGFLALLIAGGGIALWRQQRLTS
ncbi:MAG TPA: hypothetical protein G4N94_02165 [Caldilineae bacterium]|nr:hypothetical protein [Caldilineae bacterium]